MDQKKNQALNLFFQKTEEKTKTKKKFKTYIKNKSKT